MRKDEGIRMIAPVGLTGRRNHIHVYHVYHVPCVVHIVYHVSVYLTGLTGWRNHITVSTQQLAAISCLNVRPLPSPVYHVYQVYHVYLCTFTISFVGL